jgi:sugar lactone lactonase YvrE
MGKLIGILVIAFVALLALQGVATYQVTGTFAMNTRPFPPGSVETILELSEGNHPEGIAVDRQGNIYVGNRSPVTGGVLPVILKIAKDGTDSEYARLPLTTDPDAEGLLGLAVNPRGVLYAALVSLDSNQGVWKVHPDGSLEHLSGSQDMEFPNALDFDKRGYLYVTDSAVGSIWRFDQKGQGEVWVQHESLEPVENLTGGWLPGANGIAFYPPNLLYVANTSQGRIVRIPINTDGSPGTPEIVAGFNEQEILMLFSIDGIAVDTQGAIHAVIPGYLVTGSSPVVKVDPATGEISRSVTEPEAIAQFDIPLSITFGAGARDNQSVFVTNGALVIPLIPRGAGAGVVQVGVGVPGYPGR